ncbi:MAG TPA: hypothetical protein VFV66_06335 [Nonomuraea sp.]|nr:hypothetical protein [Nonomuraea sp.]
MGKHRPTDDRQRRIGLALAVGGLVLAASALAWTLVDRGTTR